MMRIGYFDTVTGNITCVMQALNLDAFPLPSSLEDRVLLTSDQGMPGYIDVGLYFAMPPQLSISHTWNWATKTWDLDLALAKAQAWARIKQARAAVLNAPLSTAHGTFDGDPVSQQNILKAALDAKTRHELGMPSDVEFTLANNTRPTFTMLQMLDVAMAMGDREKFAYSTAQTLRGQIDLATTPEQLEEIQWPGVVV